MNGYCIVERENGFYAHITARDDEAIIWTKDENG